MANGASKGKTDAGVAAVASQVAGAVGSREVANAISYVAAWKAFPSVALRVAGVTGIVVGGVKKLYDIGEKYKRSLYDLNRTYGVGITSTYKYSQMLTSLSKEFGRGTVETGRFINILKQSYTTSNLSDQSIRRLVKTVGSEFPSAIEETLRGYTQLLTVLPKSEQLFTTQSLTIADLVEVYGATNGRTEEFLRLYTQMHGLVPLATQELIEHEKAVLQMQGAWSRFLDTTGTKVANFFQDAARGLIAIGRGIKGIFTGEGLRDFTESVEVTPYLALGKELEDLTQKQEKMRESIRVAIEKGEVGEAEDLQKQYRELKDRIKEVNVLLRAQPEFEQAENIKNLKTATDEYLKQRGIIEYNLKVHDQLMGIQDAQLRILEAQYRPMQEMAGVWLNQLNILEKDVALHQQKVALLEKDYELRVKTVGEQQASLELETERRALMDSIAKVAEKEAYIRRSFMEKMMQLQLGLPKGTYAMPGGLSERSVKGPGYTPFASLERGPRGEFGETVGGKFRERQQTGPYEKFYQRTFGGGAGFRNPMEQVMQNQLSTQDEMNTKLGQIVDNTAKDFIGPPKSMEEKKWFEAPTGLTDVMGRTEPNLQSIAVSRPVEYRGSEKEITVTIAAATLEELGNLYETAIDEAVEKFASELDRRSINVSSN